jgi:hypothetical protein
MNMAGIELQQRCWNHDAREAACRCPGCGRSYCRECVSEHEGRLLCAACLSVVTSGREPGGGRVGNLAPAAMIAAAILLAWLTYWVAGESVMAVIRRMQQEPNSGAGASVWQPNTALAGVGQAFDHSGPACRLVYTDSAGESACPTLALTLVCRA